MKDYVEYPLLIRGNLTDGFQYALPIYSGTQRLLLLVDSGAELSQIGNTVLRGCSYYNTKQTHGIMSVTGTNIARKVLLHFSLDDSEYSEETYPYSIDFLVLNKKVSPYFNRGDLSGILGSNFLRFCEVDFCHALLRYFEPKDTF